MNAQIIPFPAPSDRGVKPKRIESDPHFWAFCERARRSAHESGQTPPLHAELRARYERERHSNVGMLGYSADFVQIIRSTRAALNLPTDDASMLAALMSDE